MERGYLSRNDQGLIEIAALNEDPLSSWPTELQNLPKSVTAITDKGSALVLAITGSGHSTAFGPLASVRRYRARVLIAGLDPEQLRSDRVSSLTLYFPGIGRWSGLRSHDESWGHGEKGYLKSYSVKLESPADQIAKVGRSTELAISSHWQVSGPGDRRVLYTPTAVTCRTARPRPIRELRQRLIWFHALLCLAHFGFVTADGGAAIVDTSEQHERPDYWDSRFMFKPPGVSQPSEPAFPLFTLETLGGIGSLPRWLRLCENHPRATRPITDTYLRGGLSATVRLLEVASGIEYWVNAHSRSAAWARRKGPKSQLLAQHVGSSFHSWSGNGERWADEFWKTYNRLKHEPSFSPDYRTTALLAESGALLLTAALLNRVAGTKEPSRVIFGQADRTWQIRDALKEVLL
ncbi:ApeA N-terminal domain 1-containing protein [Micromonospora profundi]|uniref:ApeA N-terminal domain 1-containing protein n=1 Tax=Micromonospora profundi TaxID=1420889 RepID=UPI003814C40C